MTAVYRYSIIAIELRNDTRGKKKGKKAGIIIHKAAVCSLFIIACIYVPQGKDLRLCIESTCRTFLKCVLSVCSVFRGDEVPYVNTR